MIAGIFVFPAITVGMIGHAGTLGSLVDNALDACSGHGLEVRHYVPVVHIDDISAHGFPLLQFLELTEFLGHALTLVRVEPFLIGFVAPIVVAHDPADKPAGSDP